jgi:hypothetical protein
LSLAKEIVRSGSWSRIEIVHREHVFSWGAGYLFFHLILVFGIGLREEIEVEFGRLLPLGLL